jgi:hypothetical protein
MQAKPMLSQAPACAAGTLRRAGGEVSAGCFGAKAALLAVVLQHLVAGRRDRVRFCCRQARIEVPD